MAKIKADFSRCKGCFLCVEVCPKTVLIPSNELGAKGFRIVQIDETKECVMWIMLQDVSGLLH